MLDACNSENHIHTDVSGRCLHLCICGVGPTSRFNISWLLSHINAMILCICKCMHELESCAAAWRGSHLQMTPRRFLLLDEAHFVLDHHFMIWTIRILSVADAVDCVGYLRCSTSSHVRYVHLRSDSKSKPTSSWRDVSIDRLSKRFPTA